METYRSKFARRYDREFKGERGRTDSKWTDGKRAGS
jgi:hypothetical protein